MCISWTINCLILLMHSATMEFIFTHVHTGKQNINDLALTIEIRPNNTKIPFRPQKEENIAFT